MRPILTVFIAFAAGACAAEGGGSGGGQAPHTGWRGLMSVGPASADGAIRCGVPDRAQFTCADGASVKRGDTWLGCVDPGQTEVGGNGAQAKGDFVLFRGDLVTYVGRADEEVVRAACITQGGEPVMYAWIGLVAENRPGFPKIEEICWDPDTGASADCAALGRD